MFTSGSLWSLHIWYLFRCSLFATADSCTFAIDRTKITVVVNLISHMQLFRNSLHSRHKVVFKAACLLQRPKFAVHVPDTLSKAYHSPLPPSFSKENCIDGVEFLLLKDKVKEIVLPLGIAKKIIRLIPRSEVNNIIHVYNSHGYVFILVSIV